MTRSRRHRASGSASALSSVRPATESARRRGSGPLTGISAAANCCSMIRTYGSGVGKKTPIRSSRTPASTKPMMRWQTSRTSSGASVTDTISSPVGGTLATGPTTSTPASPIDASTGLSAMSWPVSPTMTDDDAAPRSTSPTHRPIADVTGAGRYQMTCPNGRNRSPRSGRSAAAVARSCSVWKPPSLAAIRR